MSEGGVKGRGINGRGPRSGSVPVYAAKALDADVATTLLAAGVGWFLTHPGCPTASAGFGAEFQGLDATKPPVTRPTDRTQEGLLYFGTGRSGNSGLSA